MKKYIILLLILLLPFNVLAYSDKIIPGGDTLGIEVKNKGVIIVGFYRVKSKLNKNNLKVGDTILKVNNEEVTCIDNMIKLIEKNIKDNKVKITIKREEKELEKEIEIDKVDGVYKTGLYVKDKINGIGTLTYIDPESRIFGALGHEILESNTISKFEIKDGKIYDAYVSSIVKSRNGKAGEKNAVYDKNDIYGIVEENEISGIFGKYSKDISKMDVIEVGKINDITTGKAYIRTVIDNDKIEDFDINIINLDTNSKTKNILFEITNKRLLEKTGGVVQGMSGSPIIQNNKIIGAVNYVIVNDTSKGYGVFITTMLEEGDK